MMSILLSVYLPCLGIAFVCTAVWSAVVYYAHGVRLTPDGAMYLQAGRRETPPKPYCYRWLMPWLLRTNRTAWYWMAVTSTWMQTFALSVMLTLGLNIAIPALAAILILYLALPITRINLKYEALVDAPALATAAIAIVLLLVGHPYLAVLLSLISGMFKETGPVLAWLGAWSMTLPLSYLLLLGLIAPLVAFIVVKPGPIPPTYQWLSHPFQSARQFRGPGVFSAGRMILPWGVFLVLLPLASPSFPVVVALLLFYGTMAVATDESRLYQWSALVVIVATAPLISSLSSPVLFLMCIIQIFNPYSEVPV